MGHPFFKIETDSALWLTGKHIGGISFDFRIQNQGSKNSTTRNQKFKLSLTLHSVGGGFSANFTVVSFAAKKNLLGNLF